MRDYGKAAFVRIPLLIVAAALLFAGPPAHAGEKVWHIGLFHVGLDHEPPSLPTLHKTLNDLGYRDGENLRFDWRNQADEAEARATAQAFVRERVDLIVAFEDQVVRAAKAATSKIPIVFLHVYDPVADGHVASLSHPGGNLTGLVSFLEVVAKRLEFFKTLVPSLHRVLVLVDPNDPITPRELDETRRAAAALQLELVERAMSRPDQAQTVFAALRPGEVDGVFVVSPSLQTKFPGTILSLAREARLPLAGHRKEWVEKGALFSYAPDLAKTGPVAARYIDRILKGGAKPADLPVEQMTDIKLVVSKNVASVLGLSIPLEILARADEVIE
jgi:putative ABC transport system substrate-binding protein